MPYGQCNKPSRKAAQGVVVRVLYDDLGSISTYADDDVWELRKKGIQCTSFNPLIFVKGTLNYRDHRKMLVIDGRVAFSGGVNLADEYINKVEKFGHWKDIGFRLAGPAVENHTRMFTEFWNAFVPEACIKRIACPPAAGGQGGQGRAAPNQFCEALNRGAAPEEFQPVDQMLQKIVSIFR